LHHAVILAVLRFGGLKRYFAELNLPGSLLGIGFILLALNVALPLTYRHYINLKIGVHLDAGPDYVMNECMWLLVLPAALALVNFLPSAQTGGDLRARALPQRPWLPVARVAWALIACVPCLPACSRSLPVSFSSGLAPLPPSPASSGTTANMK
jgi:hypothetical protein